MEALLWIGGLRECGPVAAPWADPAFSCRQVGLSLSIQTKNEPGAWRNETGMVPHSARCPKTRENAPFCGFRKKEKRSVKKAS